jgi:hypothetical protein
MNMAYIGTIGKRITLEVTYTKRFEYRTHFTYYGESHNVFKMEDENGNCIVWDTTGWMEDKKLVDSRGMCKPIWEGSKLLLTATVKEHKEYKGTEQTTISRPKFTVIELAKSPEEIQAEKEAEKKRKKEAQAATITENDLVWEMPYKQYKEHYADCETVIDSYHKDRNGFSTIKVIVREDRLKNSGVRGERFSRYAFVLEDGSRVVYKAVCIDNAEKRIKKEHPNMTFELEEIYR